MVKDITGMKFGRMTVLRLDKVINKKMPIWVCRCDCGNIKSVCSNSLKYGNTQSCGCLNKERSAQKNTTHGMCHTRVYHIWNSMKRRCNNPKDKFYAFYGGKGIKYCAEWDAFEGFYEWAKSSGYKDNLTIERKDTDKGYCPDNCTWATMEQQNNNTSKNIRITINGDTKTLKQWCTELGVNYATAKARFKQKYTPEEIFYKGNFPNGYIHIRKEGK